MNKTALKNFATRARRELIKKVEAKALKIGITEENIKKAQLESSDAIYIDGKQLSITEKKQRDKLIYRINEIGYKHVVDEVAYTWFNRLTALRFMEINNYLPTKVRVLSSSNGESSEPDIIKDAFSVDLDIDKELVYELKLDNKTDELFKYLIIRQCNSLNKYLPFMFETIEDYKDILFPEGLLAKDSFLREMTNPNEIPEIDWEQVEIIGWLYQYYISEEKDRVIKAKKKYKKEEIPFATQLFTPDWIVRYMVQNSLGRYWIEAHPEQRDLLENWEFYLENSNPESDFEKKLASYINKDLRVEDIKCFDPAMGSGHILVYMFDVLFQIYRKCGYMDREIPRLIIENNLYGLDIDDRAYQLACFSVVMKAMEYNNRFFKSIEREGIILNLASIQESNGIAKEDIAYLSGENHGENFDKVEQFIEQFKDAKSIGSLIRVENFDISFFQKRIQEIQNSTLSDLFEHQMKERTLDFFKNILHQAKIMVQKYDVFITNPPYAGNKYLTPEISNYLSNNYTDVKSDFFSAFIEYSFQVTKQNGQMGFMTPFVWMFISTYERLRRKITVNRNISSLIQLEYSGFDEATVPICTFTLRNYNCGTTGEYIKLSDFKGAKNQPVKTLEAVQNPTAPFRYSFDQDNFSKIPGSPIAYWANNSHYQAYQKSQLLNEVSEIRKGLATGDTDKFIKYWFEVTFDNINFINSKESSYRWYPCHKGGGFRKWYGNMEKIINWENDGFEIKNYKDSNGKLKSRPQNLGYMLRKGITFSKITSSGSSCRLMSGNEFFDDAVQGIFLTDNKISVEYLLAVLNSPIIAEFLKILNPTLNKQIYDLERIPIIISEKSDEIFDLSYNAIEISRNEWDEGETSWDFSANPLLGRQMENSIKEVLNDLNQSLLQRGKIKFEIEEKINGILSETYNMDLENNVTTVEDADLIEETIGRKTDKDTIVELISYAIGCSFGRYSLDEEGIIYAGGVFDSSRYKTYEADNDNILPIPSLAYFEDDIVSNFVKFIKGAFGEERIVENLEFIADSLGRKDGEIAKETIRRYFLNDFFKDHVQTYKKRPIYWLFTSGKQKTFNCLIYMHRYDNSTLSKIRTDYLHELQIRLDAEKKSLLSIIEGEGIAKEISNAKKELKSLDLKIEELKVYEELLHHMADMHIEIDIDDGVVVNYAKFDGLLAKI